MVWVKAATYYVLTTGVLYFILAYIADFQMRQSIVLALSLAFLARGIETSARKPDWKFRPYYVHVDTNWYQLLTDFHMIDKPEEWTPPDVVFWRLAPKLLEALRANEYYFPRDGISFTVLQQSKDFYEPISIYWNNRRVFSSKLKFLATMEPIRTERVHDRAGLGNYDVRFFMEIGGDSYDLGIIVPYFWWNEVKASCPTPVKETRDTSTGEVKLTLATIPNREFEVHWEPIWRFPSDKSSALDRAKQRDDQRKKLGWKEVPLNYVHDRYFIEHKYFKVHHGPI